MQRRPGRCNMTSDGFHIVGQVRTMKAVVTLGNGGFDTLAIRDVPVPGVAAGEVLIKVSAASVNNTDINTRIGWYASSVTGGRADQSEVQGRSASPEAAGGWSGAVPFPLIQGTDCCGSVVETGDAEDRDLVGKRVLVRPCMRTRGFANPDCIWMGSDFDGAFAQYVKVPAAEVFPVSCGWSDIELATIPCAYGTAENMLQRADVSAGEHVLITGASGGVGSAAVQLAARRGARVTALTSREKFQALSDLGCNGLIARGEDLVASLGEKSVDVVVDNVAGPGFPQLMKLLKRGGRYVSSGAIDRPIVALDMRDLYLKDIRLIGCTAWDEPVFANLVRYIERGELRPLVAKVFPLSEIVAAQKEFLEKRHVGKLVLVPPAA